MMTLVYLLVFLVGFAAGPAMAADATEKNLYQDSIQSTKQSIAHDTLDAFYHDALDYYREGRYDEALTLLDKIYSIDPHYVDVSSLRETIHKKQRAALTETTMDSVRDWMKKGNDADHAGLRVLAVSYWKQALVVDPNYAPAQKKIQEVNQALAKKEFETGYIHYHHGELEDALESWSNAIALDPTYKERGLLLLMSKIELQVEHDQVARLVAQGFDQYQQGQLDDSLRTYDDVLRSEPRNEEARRMSAKIKIQLGQTALTAAQAALSRHDYPHAIEQADASAQYGYEISRSKAIRSQAEHAMQLARQPPPTPKPAKPQAVAATSTPAATTPSAPIQPANPEEAMAHYRQGMAAMSKKDYHLAMDELDVAAKLDASNERIYIARERARQAWTAANGSPPAP